MQIIYADTVFVTNLIINYLILLATAKLCAVPARRLRLAAAAALGGAYAVAAALPPLVFLKNPFIIAAAGVLLVTAAFGGLPRILRIILVFFAASASFAGAALAISLLGGNGFSGGFFVPISFRTLVLSFAVCYAVFTLVFRRTAANRGALVDVSVRHGGGVLTLRALVDTGNSLRDPLTGLPVIVTGVSDAQTLLPRELRDTLRGLESHSAAAVLEELSAHKCAMRFRLIPYSAVGVSGGLLLAFRPDEVTVAGNAVKPGALVALSPNAISDNGTYTALIGA